MQARFALLLAPSHLLLSSRISREEQEKGINQIGLMYPLSVCTSLNSPTHQHHYLCLHSARVVTRQSVNTANRPAL